MSDIEEEKEKSYEGIKFRKQSDNLSESCCSENDVFASDYDGSSINNDSDRRQ